MRRTDSQWLYIYIILEFQAGIDSYMAVRILAYVALLYQELIRGKHLPASARLPPVLPLVLYNGRKPWTAAVEVAELIEPVPGGLERYRPRLHYLLLEEARYSEAELAPLQNLAAALFRLENSAGPAEFGRVIEALIAWLRLPEQDSLMRAFVTWIKRVCLPSRVPGVEIPALHTLAEVKAMLAEETIDWTRRWKQEGRQEGLEEGQQEGLKKDLKEGRQEGLKEGLAAERTLLLRQAGKRFGDPFAQALTPLLDITEDQERLAAIGEGIVTCDTGEAFLSRVRELLKRDQ